MPCYHPLHAFKDKSKDASKIAIVFKRSDSWRGERIELPCGQCIGCRLERSRQWAVRCVHESSLYDKNCFVTLTYDDAHVPENGSLRLRDFQLFMKRLRREFGRGIRFFHCGEYGDSLGRPHYHALLFNHDFEDKKVFKGDPPNRVYTSGSLEKLWPFGFSTIGDVTFESAGYVARYALKKVTGERQKEFYGEKRPEYCTMSRGCKRLGTGGIGKGWFEKFKGDVFPLDRVVVRGFPQRPPRFYDKLLQKEDPALMAWLKIEREKNEKFVSDVTSDGRIVCVSDSCDRRLIEKEITKTAAVSLLSRHKDGGP